jgi:hypothetical protein
MWDVATTPHGLPRLYITAPSDLLSTFPCHHNSAERLAITALNQASPHSIDQLQSSTGTSGTYFDHHHHWSTHEEDDCHVPRSQSLCCRFMVILPPPRARAPPKTEHQSD